MQRCISTVKLNWWFASANTAKMGLLCHRDRRNQRQRQNYGSGIQGKTFSFLKVSESSGFWRSRFAAPSATRGRARNTEITDTSKGSFTSSHSHIYYPTSTKFLTVTVKFSLSLQDLDQGRAVSGAQSLFNFPFPYFYSDVLYCIFSTCLKPALGTPLTKQCSLCVTVCQVLCIKT